MIFEPLQCGIHIFSFSPPGPPESPRDLKIEYTTAVSVTLSWQRGPNGGSEQKFQIFHKLKQDVVSGWHPVGSEIPDIRKKTEDARYLYKVTGLDAGQEYVFMVGAHNQYTKSGGSESTRSTEIFATTKGFILTFIFLQLSHLTSSIYVERYYIFY